MTERLLQYLWQFQYFNKRSLALDNGDDLLILHPGRYNTNQGPDFLEAKVKIDNTILAGHVELHVKTSDWYRHAHQLDRNYDNVILHVVWQHDMSAKETTVPVLSLQSRVPNMVLDRYIQWMNEPWFIACGQQVQQAPRIVWEAWKDRMLAERLQRKAATVFSHLQQNNQHWEETAWWLLARNFGISVNAEAFEAIAQTLPITLLAKHRNQLHQLEALLLGQAGLLSGPLMGDYPNLLQKEYQHLQKKYQLQPVQQAIHFLRMRPGNFPTVRLAQLAMLLHQWPHLFAYMKECSELNDIKKMISVTAGQFWDYHYTFTDPSAYLPKALGVQMVHTILINAVIPMLFAYGVLYNEEQYRNKALQWLEMLPPEKNSICNGFTGLGIANTNAFDSQALIELKTRYCDHKRCLDCAIGCALLKRSAGKQLFSVSS